MHPRTFARALLVGAFALLGATMATNFALDPQYVFGTPLTSDDENANYRYHRLWQYQAQRDRVDGLLFASSRGKAFEAALVAQKSGASTVAKFDVTAAMITDHLPALEYVLRDKAERGERLRTVLLLIDVDSFGKLPSTNVNIDSFLPPELSGEHPARFWWRYLTVFQLRMWRGIIAHRIRGGRQAAIEPRSSRLDMGHVTMAGFGPHTLVTPAPRVVHAADEVPAARLLVATRPNLAAHLGMVARFVELCRANGIRLTVATTPMRADAALLYDPADLRDVVERLSRFVPVWDFTAPQWLAADIAYWDDWSHFKPIVGAMMLERMFGSNAPHDFGIMRGAKAQAGASLRAQSQIWQ
jgi:hypothetical protein